MKGDFLMPGYILHLTSARMFLDRLPVDSRYRNDLKVQNDFYIGNLLPDAVNPKESSHFYDSVFRDRMIVWPRPEKFLDKYRDRLEDPVFWGYFYHLYIDKKFLQEYLPGRVEYYDCRGHRTEIKEEVREVLIRKSSEWVERDRYLSEEYYYGDYTKMNTYLWERYHLPEELSLDHDPGIEEIREADLGQIFCQIKEYRKIPAKAVNNLRVFDVEELLKFLEHAADEAVRLF